MRKIGLKDFYNYKYISSLTLSPEGDKNLPILSRPLMKKTMTTIQTCS